MVEILPKIISVDDHVVEPPHVWERWLPAAYRDRGPRVERRGVAGMRHVGGGHYEQVFDDDAPRRRTAGCTRTWSTCTSATSRRWATPATMTMTPMTYEEMRPGVLRRHSRADMELNHVEASLCFPTFPRFCGQTFTEAQDHDLGLACVRAYNDWMVEEWCAGSGGRLIPLVIVPLWDAELAAAEVRRNAARGVHAVCFSEIPPPGAAVDHSGAWDPFLAACQETRTTINMHIGSSSRMPAIVRRTPGWVAPRSASTTPWRR